MEPYEQRHASVPPDGPSVPADDGDTLDHLWNAAHEMLRAMRTLLDAADEFVESQRNERLRPRGRGEGDAPEGRVHRIHIDGRDDPTARGARNPGAGFGSGAS